MKNVLQMLKSQSKRVGLMLLCFGLICSCYDANAQSRTITGQVVTAENEALPGVTIRVRETTIGTITDADGNFSLNVPEDATLEVSYVGYDTQIIPTQNRTSFNISLEENVSEMDELVVIGYGTQRKSHLTGSISKVENERLDQIAVSRVDDALIGQISGVNIQATNAEPGQAPTITVRGFGSVTADSGPAVVIDGLVVDADFLGNMNMNDIESFEILKDAASAAIYGSEGSNGVILITTKSGKAGKTKFSYETMIGFKEAFGSDDYKRNLGEWVAKEQAETGELSEATQHAILLSEASGGLDRDWQDVFFDGGTLMSHSLSARGGSENTTFSTSLKYLHDEGVVLTDDYELFTASIRVDSKLNDKLKFGISATPSYSKARRLPTSIHNPVRQSPWLPIYHNEATLEFVNTSSFPDVQVGDYFRENHLANVDLDGDGSTSRARTTGDQNAYAQYIEREHYEYKTKMLGRTYLSYKIIDGLTAKTSLGITIEQRKRTRYDGTQHHSNGNSRAQYNLQNRVRQRVVSDNTLLYTKEFGDHDLNLLGGVTIQRRTFENSTITGNGFSNDLLKNLQGATAIGAYQEINTEKNKLGYLARVNYAYQDKYLFNASFRRDGSSVFGVDSKWGNFPAVSVGWNAHNEDFIVNSNISKTLSILKLRASYGLTGAENFNVGDAIVNAWPYLALLNTSNAIINDGVTAGVSPRNIVNPLLQWEASAELTVGLDFGLLADRITGSFDYYKRVSDKLLLDDPVSYVTGFNRGIVNLGEVENSGLEFELRTKNVVQGEFSWNSTLIASTNKNELTDFGENDGALLEDSYGRNSQWINQVGQPISSFYGFVVDRSKSIPNEFVSSPYLPINGQAEDAIVLDLNGDGLITDADKTILGDPYPDFVWSITNMFSYGPFDLSVMIQGSQGAQVKNVGDQYFFSWFSNATTSFQDVVDAGIVPHTSFIQEKVLTDQIVQDADYFSLRNVTIGYNLPNNLASRIGLEAVRIYATGQNLIYKTTDEYHGFNPEFVDLNQDNNPRKFGEQRAGTPLFRTISFGLNVNF